ncbi:MAG: hypothetical protein LBB89_06505 [Treponema sp.]|jgi:hypothetical protein|nr:hypothetical protein [Treponema sp.]
MANEQKTKRNVGVRKLKPIAVYGSKSGGWYPVYQITETPKSVSLLVGVRSTRGGVK